MSGVGAIVVSVELVGVVALEEVGEFVEEREHGLADPVRSRRILPTIKAARRQSTTRSIRVAVSAWRLCVASDLAT